MYVLFQVACSDCAASVTKHDPKDPVLFSLLSTPLPIQSLWQVRGDIMVSLGHLVKKDLLDSLETKVLLENLVILVAMVDRDHLVMLESLEWRGLLAKGEDRYVLRQ